MFPKVQHKEMCEPISIHTTLAPLPKANTKDEASLIEVAKPIFCKARQIPHSATESPIDFSHWAAPILAGKKKDGKTRVCIDFSTGLNNALELNRHPLPRPDDIYAALNGAAYFSNLDLRDAYLQMELDQESKDLCVINTHRGLFQCKRLPFGVKSAPSIFQHLMDKICAGIPGDLPTSTMGHRFQNAGRTYFSTLPAFDKN
ncbi:hypothetical protein niasHT_008300 [Heterodera trifolii]|uniref:Reverse transcriptase domain-containing protein n=1 Tax=Heterodera trifolii TaxID=157864 RepID=A0ABD2M1X3_9BILA